MKPVVLVTSNASPAVIDLLASVCEVVPAVPPGCSDDEHALLLAAAHALLITTPERVDDALLRNCHRLRVVACAFRMPEHIDVAACTRRGVWVTTVMTERAGGEPQLEAARNILDVVSGDTPRGALNQVLEPAA